MSKSTSKLEARRLRMVGKSVRDIAATLHVSKSSVSEWCSDIRLTSEQISALQESMRKGSYKGRMIGAQIQKERKLERMRLQRKESIELIGQLSKRDLLMLFVGLYLGEGCKTGNHFQFVNSNPEIIKTVLVCLRKLFDVSAERVYCNVILNCLYEDQKEQIITEWSRYLNIPLSQFRKTVIITSKNKKRYSNGKSYLGTLVLRITKSSDLQYLTYGLMDASVAAVNGIDFK